MNKELKIALGGIGALTACVTTGILAYKLNESQIAQDQLKATNLALDARTPQAIVVTATPTLFPTDNMTQTVEAFKNTLTSFPLTVTAASVQDTKVAQDRLNNIPEPSLTPSPTSSPTVTMVQAGITEVPPTPAPTSTELSKVREILLPRPITRYEAQGSMDTQTHTLPSFLDKEKKDVTTEDLIIVRDAFKRDVDTIIQAENNGKVEMADFGNWAQLFLARNGRMGISTTQFKNALDSAVELKGRRVGENDIKWSFSPEDNAVFALVSPYDPSKYNEQQVLTAITYAGRARQVFEYWATTVGVVNGKDPETLRNQMEGNLGFSSLDGDIASQIQIACWRTFNKTKHPKWANFNWQQAWFIQKGSKLQTSTYPNLKDFGIGKAREVDGIEDGKGRMLLSNDETVEITFRVDPGAETWDIEVMGASDALIDYDKVRHTDKAAAAMWYACGVGVLPTMTPTVFVNPGVSGKSGPEIKQTTQPGQTPELMTRTLSPGQTPVPTATQEGPRETPIAPTPVNTPAPVETTQPKYTVPPAPSPVA